MRGINKPRLFEEQNRSKGNKDFIRGTKQNRAEHGKFGY